MQGPCECAGGCKPWWDNPGGLRRLERGLFNTAWWQVLGRGQTKAKQQLVWAVMGLDVKLTPCSLLAGTHPEELNRLLWRFYHHMHPTGVRYWREDTPLQTSEALSAPWKLLTGEELQQVKHCFCWQPLSKWKTLGNFISISRPICLKLGAKRKIVDLFLIAAEIFDVLNSFQLNQEQL